MMAAVDLIACSFVKIAYQNVGLEVASRNIIADLIESMVLCKFFLRFVFLNF